MNTALSFLYVAAGGAAGSVLRYATSLGLQRWSITFPAGTLVANLGGCFVIGLLAGLADRGGALTPQARLLLMTGFCGGYTTLSTFQYELAGLVGGREALLAGAYIVATVAGGLLCFYGGQFSVRALFS